jgi:XapX domain-containing protein
MIGVCAGVLIGLLVGAGSRWGGIPVPSPPTLVGALLMMAMTVGYAFTDAFLASKQRRRSTSAVARSA